MTQQPVRDLEGIHHTAYACRDVDATVDFYENVLGFPLVHTEHTGSDAGWFQHIFFDTGDGSCIAFFDLHGVGETDDWSTEVTGVNGQPIWVTHIAFHASEDDQDQLIARLAERGQEPLLVQDHDWCYSVYVVDPNGIMVEFCRDTPGIDPDRSAAHSALRR